MNNLKRQEKGQTIRGSSVGEGVPFAEVFSTTTDKDSIQIDNHHDSLYKAKYSIYSLSMTRHV
jgi:hypothetical protein